jgi:hypothetical protein
MWGEVSCDAGVYGWVAGKPFLGGDCGITAGGGEFEEPRGGAEGAFLVFVKGWYWS